MTTFEQTKRFILRDMAASTTHNAESWATILLRNTARLQNKDEQDKFWTWFLNPHEDIDLPVPVLGSAEAPVIVAERTTIPYEDDTVEVTNTITRKGFGVFCRTEPVNPCGVTTSALSLTGPESKAQDQADEKSSENVSNQ